jgi:glycosyltransferase involved in cell wall biosynthesis
MSPRPLVTVIIPSYNHAQYIRAAIDSVLTQTYDNLELIVVDDGSRDSSQLVISEYSEHPKVTIILNNQNRGQSAVLNQALAVSRGEYISLLPSDDWFLPDKTSLQVAKMMNCNDDVGVVYAAGTRYFEDTGEMLDVKLPVHTGWIAQKLIEQGNFIYPASPLYRREVFDKVRPSEKFRAEGEAIHLRIALHYRYEYIPEIVVTMRDHSYNIGKDSLLLYSEIQNYLEWYFEMPEMPDDIRALRGSALFRNNAVKGLQLIVDRRNFKLGRECLWRAFKFSPRRMFKLKYAVAYLVSLLPAIFANTLLDRLKNIKNNRVTTS